MSGPAAAKDDRANVRVRLTLLAIVAFFGGSLPFYKLASESFGPGTSNLIRFTIAACLVNFLARGRQRGTPLERRRENIRLLVLGLFGMGLMAATMAIGVDEGSAVIASIIVGLEPVGVALAGVLLVGDKPSMNSLLALIVGVFGVVVASGLLTEPIADVPVLSIFLLLSTVITFSVYTAFVRRTGQGVDPLVISGRTQLGALLLVIPSCLLDFRSGGMIRGDITARAFIGVLLLGFGSALAYLLLCLALANQPSNRIAVSMFLTPMFGVFFSWLIVNERLRVRDGIAGIIVLCAVWISEWAPPIGRRSLAAASKPNGS
jgi:drug/metabolite transporter (DMT)-like permease